MDYGIYARDDYYFGYSDAEFKSLYAQSEVELDDAVKDDLLRKIQAKIADDAVEFFEL